MSWYCNYEQCQYHSSLDEKLQIIKVLCPLCLQVTYCSSQCRNLDWAINHKFNCESSSPTRTQSQHEKSQKSESHKRKPQDFEFVQLGNKQELGRGAYGCVQLVRDKLDNGIYAMKIIKKRIVFEFSTVQNMKREVKLQKNLKHAHICQLYYYFEDKKNVYLILEYAQNGSLHNYIRRRVQLPEREAFIYFFQTCLGIDYLHKNNIMHRDLKPENLLLNKEGNIKICDFGWSAQTLAEKRTTYCGTYEYMSPEMLNKEPHDSSVDIWSLGILLYELINGSPPFLGRSISQQFFILQSKPKLEFSSNFSQQVQSLIRGLLKYDPNDRLTMNQIFQHEWMQLYAKEYKINLWQYVYKPQQQLVKNNEINNIHQEKTLSVLEKLFIAMGCLKRDKQ